MKLILFPLTLLAASISASSLASAAAISGSVNFSSGAGGGVVFQDSMGNVTTNLATATGVQAWSLSQVDEGTGSFNTVADGTAVTFSQPWVFNPSSPKTPLWVIAGPENFTFNLTSATVAFQNESFLAIRGTGILTGNGFTPTPGNWFFTTQGQAVQSQFSWSSSTASVPDGGATAILLGGSLIGLFAIQKRLSKA